MRMKLLWTWFLVVYLAGWSVDKLFKAATNHQERSSSHHYFFFFLVKVGTDSEDRHMLSIVFICAA